MVVYCFKRLELCGCRLLTGFVRLVLNQVAALCAQNSPENRPTMQEVVGMLTEDTEGPLKRSLPHKAGSGMHLEAVKYDPALLAPDETPCRLGSRKSPLSTG